jgi:RNA polymerase sigma-70 factor (ECF subfamily)
MQDLEATVERCRSGDEEAWSALVGSTIRPLYRLCASYSRSSAEAEELTQEVFLKLWQNLHQYRPGSNFMAWAWRVARNLVIDAHRRARKEREAAWLEPEVLDRLPAVDDPEEDAHRRQRLRMVATALRHLEPELSEIVVMRDLAGLSYQEIAAALELPLGTVKSRLNRARLELTAAVRRRMSLKVVPATSEGAS